MNAPYRRYSSSGLRFSFMTGVILLLFRAAFSLVQYARLKARVVREAAEPGRLIPSGVPALFAMFFFQPAPGGSLMKDTDMTARSLARFDAEKRGYLEDLEDLIRIPSISFPGFDPAAVRKSAEAVSGLLKKYGLADVRILETGKGHPSVFAQWQGAPGRPTVLLYAHHDVQPTGRDELWTTPPFRPDVREGRLYGRGAADDKGGVMMHIAAVASCLTSTGSLPLNVKLIIEGEEEVGSTNLGSLLVKHPDLFAAHVVVIADSENFDSGVPTLTASLRGIVTVNIEVRSLSSSVHSGTWGGPLPDPVLALAGMLASLVDAEGRPAVPGLVDRVREIDAGRLQALGELPFDEQRYRAQSRLKDGSQIIGGAGTVYEKMWYRPSLAVNAVEASSRKQASNIINDAAWARVGVRTVPDMDAEETIRLLRDHLVRRAPWGVEVNVEAETPSPWWMTATEGPAFEAALAALGEGYGARPVVVGAGGSIPFVRTITDALGGKPALLLGVGDPSTGAHSENESLLLSDWEKGCKSLIRLFAELADRLTF